MSFIFFLVQHVLDVYLMIFHTYKYFEGDIFLCNFFLIEVMPIIKHIHVETLLVDKELTEEQITEIEQMFKDELAIEFIIQYLQKEGFSLMNENEETTKKEFSYLELDFSEMDLEVLEKAKEILSNL